MTSEAALLRHIYERSRNLHGAGPIELGPGDDAAVMRFGGERLLLTVDQLVEGRHYDPATTPVDLIARKAVARSVSDIAAMAGTPVAALATGALRDGFAQDNALFDAMARWASRWGCPLIGGDIARVQGPTVLTVTVLGRAHPARGPALRSGAKEGDGVYLTGAIGGSLRSGRHLSFEPRLREAAWLAGVLGDRLRAMLDVSDGLGRDAARIAEASGVRVEIDPARIPLHPDAGAWAQAAAEGEDYELLFTASGAVPDRCPETGVTVTRIGSVLAGAGCVARERGGVLDLAEMGWDHAG